MKPIDVNRLKDKRFIRNVPNYLTGFRVLLIPVIMIILPFQTRWTALISVILFAIGSITDGLDGYIARKYNAVTKIGKLLDPIADKMYVSAALVMLVSIERINPWAVVILLTREFAISGLRVIAIEDDIKIPVGNWGKWKSALQMLGIGGLMIWHTYYDFPFRLVGNILIYLAVFFSITSAIQYFRKYFSIAPT